MFSSSGDYNDGDSDGANDDDDGDDDDDDDDDESGYLHHGMETRHDLEINGNQGRRLVRAETDPQSGTQSEPWNMRAKEPRKVATRRSWGKPLSTSLYPFILTGIVCG